MPQKACYEASKLQANAPHHLRQQRMEWEQYHLLESFSKMPHYNAAANAANGTRVLIFQGLQHRGHASPATLLQGWGTVQYCMSWGCESKYQQEEGKWD
jgi:hypothetical protein